MYITWLMKSIMSKMDFGHQGALLHVFFLGFGYFFKHFLLLPLLLGPMMMLSQLIQLIRCTPSQNQIVHICAQKGYFWGLYDQK